MKCFTKKKDYFNTLTQDKQQYISYLNLLINDLNQKCIIIQKQIVFLNNKLKNINDNNNLLCSICMENKIDCAFVSCGHTFCSKCVNEHLQINRNTCFLCRSKVFKKLKIYI